VGGGLIGGAWAAFFLSRGLAVRLHDPRPDAEAAIRPIIDQALADLAQLAPLPVIAATALQFCSTLGEAVGPADYVQENAPEVLALKQALLARIDAVAAPDVLIGSSTSSLRATDLQRDCRHPERVMVAHPFNPPHLVPLVELVRGDRTAPLAQDAAYDWFESLGKAPIRVAKEATGHVANRMSSALWREAVHIVAQGIASVEDVDRAIRYGPGLRWAIEGPHMLYHLGGGAGGMAAYLDHLGPAQEARWAELGTPTLDAATRQLLVAGIAEEAAGRTIGTLAAERDQRLIAVLQALDEAP
jgi:carnitine 3-dehydrogenase